MPKYTRNKNKTNRNKTRKNKKRIIRKIHNPSGLSQMYISVYGPRKYKGGVFVPTPII
jgi:hypothetical protein